LYIGRQRRWPEPLKRSFWANPYKLKEHGGPYTLAESLYLYELRVRSSPEMLERLHELVGGKTLLAGAPRRTLTRSCREIPRCATVRFCYGWRKSYRAGAIIAPAPSCFGSLAFFGNFGYGLR
jgi:hypothetical protein